ncbi:hypothetical protein QOZ80_7BG0609390 [Eleusine coracana subsp. coracana]|nr:hypothetical protein QOZ80_7BG0609390 [Eleusine coracana subsp. coracana]
MELQLPPATGGQQQAAESHAVDIHLRPSAVAAPDEDDDGESSAQRRPVDVDVQSRPAPVGDVADDCHVVNIEPQSVAIQLIALVGDTESSSGCHVIVDAKPPDSGNGAAAAAAAADEDDENCCVVCTDPLVLAAVGRCGHRVVCRKCAVRLRFFYRNKRCCICRAYCFKVTITNKAADATTTIMPPLLFLAFWEGRVTGKYWYHRHTAAFFEDEEEYKAAKKACQGILTPFYKPVVDLVHVFLVPLC